MYPSAWGEASNSAFADEWISAHGAACQDAGKPCLLEEYGTGAGPPGAGDGFRLPASNISLEQGWQKSVLATEGFGGDLFWDLGVVLPSAGRTPDDGNTVFVDDVDAWEVLVQGHVRDVGERNEF